MNQDKNTLNHILIMSEEERFSLKHPYVGSEHLFLTILKTKNSVSNNLKKYNVTYTRFKKELISVVGSCTKDCLENLYTPLLRKIIKRSETINKEVSDIYESLFISLLDEGEGIAVRILLRMNVDLDEIYINLKEKEKLLKMEESNKVGILLNKSINLNEKVLCREQELEKLILSLTRKKKCNPLLVGAPGVGKTAIVEELVRRIEKKKVPNSLLGTKIYMIEMGSLISGTKYRGEFEERLNLIIKEIINYKKAIIFIDEIHSMVKAGGAEGAISASDILKPYLARGDIKCIGATTNNEYRESILKDKALARRFDVININEPSKDDMYKLLLKVKKEYELFHNIKVSNKIINKIIDLSDYYMKSLVNPDKSIDLLDSSCAYAKINNKKELTEEDILNVIFYKTSNCFIKNKEFTKRLNDHLVNYINKNDISKIINAFKNKCDLPVSLISSNNNLLNIIKEELNDINVISIDLESINDSIYTNKNIEETKLKDLIEKPYSLIDIKNIDSANKLNVNEIIKMNKEGFIVFKNNEKVYLNNAVIMASIDSNSSYNTGFSKSQKTKIINKELLDSFNLDLRNITLKEYISL